EHVGFSPTRQTSGGGGGGRTHLLLALSRLIIDRAPLSRRSTVPTPNRDTSNIWVLVAFSPPHVLLKTVFAFLIPFLFRRLWYQRGRAVSTACNGKILCHRIVVSAACI
ncbi:unnamed protein product, partial [Laminaria digitata]